MILYRLYFQMTIVAVRTSLQKNIMALLRKIEHCVNGVQPVSLFRVRNCGPPSDVQICPQAWEETFRNWDLVSRQLTNYPKSKVDDSQTDAFRATGKRRTSHQNSEHELEDQINEWANMTGFLCALGGVCLQRKSPCRPTSGITPYPEPKKGSSKQDSVSLGNSSQEVQYCPVTQFVFNLLRLLICNNERLGMQIQKHVKELVSHEMSSALYPILFDQIKSIVDKFFDQQGQVIVTDVNTQFIEHTIFIMKNVLDSKTDEPSEYLGNTSVEGMTLAIVKYVRHLDMNVHAILIKTKLCQFVEAMMKRRDDLAFRQEMKFRNKLVEYLTDWVMGTAHHMAPSSGTDVTSLTKYAIVFEKGSELIHQLCFSTARTPVTLTKLVWQLSGHCYGVYPCNRRNRIAAI